MRRAKGEGSVFFDNTRKKWVAQHSAGGRTRKRYRRTKREAADALAELTATAGLTAAPARTLGAYLMQWYTTYKEPFIKENTKTAYKVALSHINKGIGRVALDKLTSQNLQFFINRFSSGTSRSLIKVLNSALERAFDDGLIKKNFSKKLKASSASARRVRDKFLDVAEVLKIAGTKDRFSLAVKIMLYAGLRRNEMLALKWDDVDFSSSSINISGSLFYRSKSDWRIDTPKTAKSLREVPLADMLALELRRYRHAQIEKYLAAGVSPPQFIISDAEGRPINPVSFSNTFIARARALGLNASPHTVRHSFATAMRSKIPLDDLAELLGHSAIATTAHIYAHEDKAVKERKKSAINSL